MRFTSLLELSGRRDSNPHRPFFPWPSGVGQAVFFAALRTSDMLSGRSVALPYVQPPTASFPWPVPGAVSFPFNHPAAASAICHYFDPFEPPVPFTSLTDYTRWAYGIFTVRMNIIFDQ
jgi:hypothetical protein